MPALERRHRHSLFTSFANHTAHAAGHPATFTLAVLIIIGWAVSGPIFHFSDTWQLIINTGTTIVTFLMVFLIQNTQNRDSQAMHLKLDEVIRALDGAHNTLLNLEDLEDQELQAIHKRYARLAQRARDALERGEADTAVVDIAEEAEGALKATKATGASARTAKAEGAERSRKAR